MAVTRGSSRGRDAKNNAGKGRFTGQLSWQADEVKYIQIVTPEDEWVEADMYFGKLKGQTRNGKDRLDWFVQDDPKSDPIAEKFNIRPKLRTLCVAVELEPQYKSGAGKRKEIVGFDLLLDEETEDPVVGLINQSHIFYGALYTYAEDFGPVDEKVFHVRRTGGDMNTAYNFTAVGDAIDLDEDVTDAIDLDAWVEEHMSEDHYEQIEELPEDWIFDRFQQKSAKKETSRSGRTRTRSRNEEPEDDSGDDEPEEETRPARRSTRTTTRATRESKFNKLRERSGAKSLAEDEPDGDDE
jgi:hypothetical protein